MFGNILPVATESVKRLFLPKSISGMKSRAWYAPHATKVQLAPCHSPLIRNIAKVLRITLAFFVSSGCLLSGETHGREPPKGMYK